MSGWFFFLNKQSENAIEMVITFMKILGIFLLTVILIGLNRTMLPKSNLASYQASADIKDPFLSRLERELMARLKYEILWGETPANFKVPKNGIARLGIYSTGDTLAYCSRDLGVCAKYNLIKSRIDYLTNKGKCLETDNNIDCITNFTGTKMRGDFPREISSERTLQPVGILSEFTIIIGGKNSVIDEYKKLHPTELSKLRKWVQNNFNGDGYKSATIACFNRTDPSVYIYGNRLDNHGGPLIVQVFWDADREEWLEAGFIKQSQNQIKFNELKATIQSITCGSVRLNQ